METYIYVDKSQYLEDGLTTYEELVRRTEGFTNLKNFELIRFNILEFCIDSKSTRIIYKNKSYVVSKNFVDIENRRQFIILKEHR